MVRLAPKAEILRNRFGATAECNSLSSFTVPFGRQFVLNTAHRGVEIPAFSIGATPTPQDAGAYRVAIFDDNCGNFVQLIQLDD